MGQGVGCGRIAARDSGHHGRRPATALAGCTESARRSPRIASREGVRSGAPGVPVRTHAFRARHRVYSAQARSSRVPKGAGSRPSSSASVESTAANSPWRAAAKMLSIRSAIGAGAPCARACSR